MKNILKNTETVVFQKVMATAATIGIAEHLKKVSAFEYRVKTAVTPGMRQTQ